MLRALLPSLAALLLVVSWATPPQAQVRPTPAQAQQLLQQRPELAAQLRERISTSGLTPEQVRSRLRAQGFQGNELDAYLIGGALPSQAPDARQFAAVETLGIVDPGDLEELMRLSGIEATDRRTVGPRRIVEYDPLVAEDTTLSPESAELFGLRTFRESSTLFLPNLDGPVDANYRLGPGDQLVLILTGDVELAYELDVSREGFVVIPRVGQIPVANLTLLQVEDLLYQRLGRVYSGVRRGASASTRFSISVARLRSNQVFVVGDVVAPGSYRVTSAGTALTALYAAGGPTDRGSLRRVEIRRGGALVSTLDVYDYLLRGDGGNDVRLQNGDHVFVPVRTGRVRIDGAVVRPATYELVDGETLDAVLASAGGLRATAGGRRVVVERILPTAARSTGRDRAVIDVPLGPDGSAPAFPLVDGDVVRVPGIADRSRGMIRVRGHVWSAGMQGFEPGLTLAQALRRAGGLKPDAYLGSVLVSRLRPDSTRQQLRAMVRDSTGATFESLVLQEDDEIEVFSRTDFRPEQYVVIGGAVRNTGRFPYRDGMTLRDLVLLAGGLEKTAFLKEAEVARVPLVRDANALATTLRVRLDSSYRFDIGTPGGVREPEIALQAYDNVLILQDPEWREPATVVLTGEVRFPGPYTLLTRGERLSNLLRRAGGLTPEADEDAAHFSRLSTESVDRDVELTAARRASRDTAQTSGAAAGVTAGNAVSSDSASLDDLRVARALDHSGTRVRVGIDLRRVLRGERRADDLILVAGDSVHIPERKQTVEVIGGVNAPTAIAHQPGMRLGGYLDAAGGTSERARARRAYVVQPNGKIESRRRLLGFITLDPRPLPGAVVVVPERDPTIRDGTAFQNLSVLAQTVAAIATLIAVSRR